LKAISSRALMLRAALYGESNTMEWWI
jgi:hypothetical protein